MDQKLTPTKFANHSPGYKVKNKVEAVSTIRLTRNQTVNKNNTPPSSVCQKISRQDLLIKIESNKKKKGIWFKKSSGVIASRL